MPREYDDKLYYASRCRLTNCDGYYMIRYRDAHAWVIFKDDARIAECEDQAKAFEFIRAHHKLSTQ